jgi:hypothetical protein
MEIPNFICVPPTILYYALSGKDAPGIGEMIIRCPLNLILFCNDKEKDEEKACYLSFFSFLESDI